MAVIFNDFNSDNFGLRQLTRSMDALQEQEITESIPGVQGTVDYSMMFGQRLFQPQTITYTFQKYIYDVVERARQEALIRNSLSRFGLSRLYDSYIPENYYFLAKCNPTVTNDVQYQKLTVSLAFTCNPPFMFCEIPEGNDEWDTFNFDYDVSQDTSFTVNNGDVVSLINPGSAAVQPKITVTGTIKVSCNGNEVTLSAGTYENTLIYLLPGMNSLTLTGTGTISFEFYKELIA
jgi:spore coat protein U-like protein